LIPNNFKPVSWNEVNIGDVVYIAAPYKDKWYVRGDGHYTVADKIMKRLRNRDHYHTFSFEGFLLVKVDESINK